MEYVNRLLIDAIREDINTALKAVARKHGLQTLETAKCIIGRGRFDFKVEGMLKGGKTKEQERYESASFLNLPPFGSKFVSKGTEYTITGLNTTGTKILASGAGKMWTWPVESVKKLVGKGKVRT